MICSKCGSMIEDDAIFCPACGSRLRSAETAAVQSVTDIQPYETFSSGMTGAAEPSPIHGVYDDGFGDRVVTGSPSFSVCGSKGDAAGAAVLSAAPKTKKRRSKEFFGRGAFILCLVLIALLAGSTGAFAYLYFHVIGAI